MIYMGLLATLLCFLALWGEDPAKAIVYALMILWLVAFMGAINSAREKSREKKLRNREYVWYEYYDAFHNSMYVKYVKVVDGIQTVYDIPVKDVGRFQRGGLNCPHQLDYWEEKCSQCDGLEDCRVKMQGGKSNA